MSLGQRQNRCGVYVSGSFLEEDVRRDNRERKEDKNRNARPECTQEESSAIFPQGAGASGSAPRSIVYIVCMDVAAEGSEPIVEGGMVHFRKEAIME